MVDENYTALLNHEIGKSATFRAYILDHRFGFRLYIDDDVDDDWEFLVVQQV